MKKKQLLNAEDRESIENLIAVIQMYGEKVQELSDKITCDDYIKLHGVLRTSPEGKYFLRCVHYTRDASDDLFIAASRLQGVLDDFVEVTE